MYGATEDALLQKTLLKLPEEKRGKRQVRNKRILLGITSNRSQYASPRRDKDGRNV